MDAGACCRTCRGTGFAAINTLVSYAIRSMSFIFSKPPQHSQRLWESAVASTYDCNVLAMREIRQCVAPYLPPFFDASNGRHRCHRPTTTAAYDADGDVIAEPEHDRSIYRSTKRDKHSEFSLDRKTASLLRSTAQYDSPDQWGWSTLISMDSFSVVVEPLPAGPVNVLPILCAQSSLRHLPVVSVSGCLARSWSE